MNNGIPSLEKKERKTPDFKLQIQRVIETLQEKIVAFKNRISEVPESEGGVHAIAEKAREVESRLKSLVDNRTAMKEYSRFRTLSPISRANPDLKGDTEPIALIDQAWSDALNVMDEMRDQTKLLDRRGKAKK